jgi:hypothetical protein
MHVAISNTSGLAGIAYWINDYYDLPDEYKIEKTHPVIAKIKEEIDRQYAEGRCSVLGDDELDGIIMMIDKEFHKKLLIYGE